MTNTGLPWKARILTVLSCHREHDAHHTGTEVSLRGLTDEWVWLNYEARAELGGGGLVSVSDEMSRG